MIPHIEDKIKDTGWVDLELLAGRIATSTMRPQVRRIGNIVYIRGAVTGIADYSKVIAKLDKEFTPNYSHKFITNNNIHVAELFGFQLLNNGELSFQTYIKNGQYVKTEETTWINIYTSYIVD